MPVAEQLIFTISEFQYNNRSNKFWILQDCIDKSAAEWWITLERLRKPPVTSGGSSGTPALAHAPALPQESTVQEEPTGHDHECGHFLRQSAMIENPSNKIPSTYLILSITDIPQSCEQPI
jgi:hypothetical protein